MYWLETHPEQRGRQSLYQWSSEAGVKELTPFPMNLRTRVHEYGGGEYAIHEGHVIATNDHDNQLLYCKIHSTSWQPIPLQLSSDTRFANFCWHPNHQCVVAIREQHIDKRVQNDLVLIFLDGRIDTLATGADFYSSPAISSDGKSLAWIEWNNPFMPWDATRLMQATLDDALCISSARCMNGEIEASVQQPRYSPQGKLHAMSDAGGFWNLCQFHDDGVVPVLSIEKECAMAPWSFNQRTYDFVEDEAIVLAMRHGKSEIWRAGNAGQALITKSEVCAPYIACSPSEVFRLCSSSTSVEKLVATDLSSGTDRIVRQNDYELPGNTFVRPILHHSANAVPFWLYRSNTATQPAPTVIFCHSGPTGLASPALNPVYQYWLSCGFNIAEPNYRGSEGEGRQWRQSLLGHWGEFDVDDCLDVAQWLIDYRKVLPGELFLRGNSAGGFTALHMLAKSSLFAAAALRYPVVDLKSLAAASHKFEAAYLMRLVGATLINASPLEERSPLGVLHQIRTPTMTSQGDADPVVPLEQANLLQARLSATGVESRLQVFEGEGHGFRRSETLKSCLSAEVAFFQSFLTNRPSF